MVYLHVTLDEIERSDGRVSKATAQNPSGRTGGVVGRRVHLDLLIRRRNHHSRRRRRVDEARDQRITPRIFFGSH